MVLDEAVCVYQAAAAAQKEERGTEEISAIRVLQMQLENIKYFLTR